MAANTSPAQPSKVGIQRQYNGCSSIREYEIIAKLGEGTFGEVHKARSRKTGRLVALKKILMHNEKDGFPITALREIKLLKLLSHDNILKLEEMAIERPKGEGHKKAITYMVTPYAEHDLSGLLDNPDVKFTEPQIKCYMLQLLEGLKYLHDSKILHRDMKAANLLITNNGILKIADFGLARNYYDSKPQPGKGGGEAQRDYTALVVTRWYRPPELLLSLRKYTTAIDMWGAGCVFGEMFKRKPILAGNSDLNQAHLIFDLVGSPNDENMPGWSALPGCDGVKQFPPKPGNLAQVFREQGSSAISLMRELLKLDWKKRINAMDAMKHPYFKTDPLPARPEDLPQYADSHELDRRNSRGQKQVLPPAPAGGSVGFGNGDGHGPNGPPPGLNSGQWSNGDRGPRHGHDRAPPGPPPGTRGPPPPHDRGFEHRGARQPNWQDRGQPRGQESRHPLPPRPSEGMHQMPNAPYRSGDHRDRLPANSKVDTYIPAYNRDRGSKERDDVPSREGRRGSRDSGDGRPISRDGRGRRDDYRDRDRGPRDPYDRRSTRSRSPERDRRERDRRDRDPYHRR